MSSFKNVHALLESLDSDRSSQKKVAQMFRKQCGTKQTESCILTGKIKIGTNTIIMMSNTQALRFNTTSSNNIWKAFTNCFESGRFSVYKIARTVKYSH